MSRPSFKYSIIGGFHEASCFPKVTLVEFSLAYFLKEILINSPLLLFSPVGVGYFFFFFRQDRRKSLSLIDSNRALHCLSPNLHTLFYFFFFPCTVFAISPHLPLILLGVNLFISAQRRMHDPNLPPILSSTHRSHRMRQYAATSANEPCPKLLFFYFLLFKDSQ